MTGIQDKLFPVRTQGRRPRVRAATPTAQHSARQEKKARRAHPQKKRTLRKKRRELPLMPPAIEAKRGKTTIRRLQGRCFIRFEEIKGKTVDYVEVYLHRHHHSLAIMFQDKTDLRFMIEPEFTLETEQVDWKTGDRRQIKKWPLIRSESVEL